MGYKLIGKNKLIPRSDFIGRRRVQQPSQTDTPFENVGLETVYTEFTVENCSVQPPTGRALRDYSMKLQNDGLIDHDCFLVFSGTMLKDSKQGTGILADQIFLPDVNGVERWFTVLKTDRYVTSGVERYQSFVVAEPEE